LPSWASFAHLRAPSRTFAFSAPAFSEPLSAAPHPRHAAQSAEPFPRKYSASATRGAAAADIGLKMRWNADIM
jgi:hypothetical protein